jgi:hypothetical protein
LTDSKKLRKPKNNANRPVKTHRPVFACGCGNRQDWKTEEFGKNIGYLLGLTDINGGNYEVLVKIKIRTTDK